MEKLELRPELVNNTEIVSWKSKTIETQADAETCGNYIKICADRRKEIKAEADKVSKPLSEALKGFREMVKKAISPVEDTERALRNRLQSYWDARQREIDEKARKDREVERQRLEREAKKRKAEAMVTGDMEAFEASKFLSRAADLESEKKLNNKQTMKLSTGTIAQSSKWDWEIVDEKQIPAEFFVLDEKKLNSLARGMNKNPIEVPGVKFTKKSIVSVR